MADVTVHYRSSRPLALQARAYTQGRDIFLAAGQERHLPHETWHAAQQRQQRIPATTSINGSPINDDPALEREAERMGERATRLATGPAPSTRQATRRSVLGPSRSPAQRMPLVGNTATDLLAGGALTAWSNASWLSGSTLAAAKQVVPSYAPVTTGAGFATGMYAIIKGYPLAGQAADLAPANPAWNALTRKKTATGGTFYVRAHLLRDKFGGLATWNNLTPLTNRGNNPSSLSHLHTVEKPIENALKAKRVVGYRVVPIYGGFPLLDLPRTLVNTFIGLIPGDWCRELRDILYYENSIPSALWTSWWYHDSWNPIPSVRLVRNWTTFEQSYRYQIGNRKLSFAEWMVLGVAEVLKLALSGLIPAGIWSTTLGLIRSLNLPLTLPAVLNLETIATTLDTIQGSYGFVGRALGNLGSRDLNDAIRSGVPGQLGGWVPALAEGAVVGTIARHALA